MIEPPLDPREHPFRADLAASYLEGKVDAARFADGEMVKVSAGVLPLHRKPDAGSGRDSELLFGERFMVYDRDGEWVWGQGQTDGYVGYALEAALSPDDGAPTHEIRVPRTHAFEKPDLKTRPVALLHMTSRIRVDDEADGYCHVDAGGWVPRRHLAAIGETEADIVETARSFMHTPYLWGGRSSLGMDCSALVQFALLRAGRSAPRDSDQQERSIGAVVDGGVDAALPGDLLYLKGHVVMVAGANSVIHANAHHMAVAEEPLDGFLDRMGGLGLSVTTVRRVMG